MLSNFLRKLFSRWQIYVDVPNVSIIIGYLHKYVNKNCWTNSRDTSNLRHCDRRSSDVTVMFLVTSLTHWGRVTHMCVSKLTIIGLANGLSPGRRRAIISTNAGILLIWPLGTNFSEIYIKIRTFPFKKLRLKVSSAKWRLFCLGLSVLTTVRSLWQWMGRPSKVTSVSLYVDCNHVSTVNSLI